MPFSVHLSALQFSAGSPIGLGSGQLVLIVGPNNSGKSAALRGISEKLKNPAFSSPVISSIQTQRTGNEDELLTWLGTHGVKDIKPNPTDAIFRSKRGSIWRSSAIANWRGISFGDLAPWICALLTAEARLNGANAPGRVDLLSEAASHPLHLLEKDDSLEAKLCGYFRKAFGTDLILNRGAGAKIPLMVGDRPVIPAGQDRVSLGYLSELAKLPQLESQGDGMRSFVSVLLETFVSEEPIVLIDEPEAFLHPPQARLLGRMLAEAPNARQIVVATHSSDILRGALSVAHKSVGVLRITRTGTSNFVTCLDTQDVKQFWSDPLLRFSNVLDGLFHEKVVLCESDSDCRFYSAIADAIYEAKPEGFRIPDVLYVHCGGKARQPLVIRALRKISVPVVTVVDFDVLNAERPLRDIFEESGGSWTTIESDWRTVKSAVDQKRPELGVDEAKREITAILDRQAGLALPASGRSEIEKVLRRSSAWSTAKSSGKTYVPNGQPTVALERLFQQLRAVNVHVVEVGELESFARSVGNHGPAWVNEALQRNLRTDAELEGARQFVGRFAG